MDPSLFFPLGAIFFLIIASGFFSGSETGLTAASRAKIHTLKKQGDKNAALVEKLRRRKDRLIGTILLGNNAVNIMASAIATSVAIRYYGDDAVIYVTVTMTMLILIFAEVLPKTYAFHNAEQVSLKTAPIMVVLVKILAPVTAAVQAGVNVILHGVGGKKTTETMSVDELRGTIDLHHHEGRVIKRDRDMLGSILDLSETEVNEVMVHRKNITSINVELPPGEIIAQVLDNTHTRIPLWKDKPENIVGILHVKALLTTLRSYEGDINDINILSIASEPWFIPDTTTLNNQLFRFRQRRNHMAVVVDEYGDLVGLITLEDILEEIVGHIYDEYDIATQGIKRLKSGKIQVIGELTIRDLNRAMDWELPDEDAATIAGLVIHKAETIPEVGQKFEFFGFRFKILKRQHNQITSLQIEKLPQGGNL